MAEEIDERVIREQLRASDEEKRYKALVSLRDSRSELSSQLARELEKMEEDPSRPVRQLARDLLAGRMPGRVRPEEGEIPTPLKEENDANPGSGLLALTSFGSALTGLLLTGMSILNYFTLGHFPFPDALDVLLAVNIILTVPYLIIGVLLLAPGKVQKSFARFYAYVSFALCMVLVLGLEPAYDRWWAIQFIPKDQAMFRNFLAPVQLLMLFLPIIAGQALLLYYLGQYSSPGPERLAANEVDTTEKGD